MTRPGHQSGHLSELIVRQGGGVVLFPTLEIKTIDGDERVSNKLQMPGYFHWLFFVSVNAVNFAVKANNGKIDVFKQSRIAAIGKATAETLREHGLNIDLLPENGFNSEALLEMPVLHDMRGTNCLIIRGRGGREKLADSLRKRGASVEYLEIYQRIRPTTDSSGLISLLEQNQLSAVTITSAEALKNLLAMVGERPAALLTAIPLVVISDRIRRLAEAAGFKTIAVTEEPADSAILDTLIMLINGENSGRSN